MTRLKWQGRSGGLLGWLRWGLLCLALFMASFYLSLWFFFPVEALQRRLLQEGTRQTGLQLEGGRARLLFPLGLQLDLRVFPDPPLLAPVELQQLRLTPDWLSLLSPDPALVARSQVSSGRLSLQASRQGDVALQLRGVELAGLQLAEADYRLRGTLNGDLKAEQLSAALTGSGNFQLRLQQAELTGLQRLGLPDELALGEVLVGGILNQRDLTLERLAVSGGVLELSGEGQLRLGPTPQQTRLNLNLLLRPTPATPAALRDLLSLTGATPAADGSYPLRLGGTLALPQLR